MRTAALALLVGCGAPQHPVTASFGTAAPYTIVAMPEHGRWSVICQARKDTNKNGKLDAGYELHGELKGDEMLAYYVDPRGRETVIDNVLAYTDRYLAFVENDAPYVIDTQTGKRRLLAGTLPEFRIATGVRTFRFDPSGEHLLFFRNNAPIVYTLATSKETQIAPAAWTAEWSADGSWVELAILDGDTNNDGFIHGPDLSPSEGIPGNNCGHKFNWSAPLFDLDPKGERIEAALASLEAPDKLVHRLWRISDGFTIAGETGVDRDTIITRTADGALAIGPVGAAGAPLATADCSVAGVSPPLRAALVTCPAGDESDVFWFRDGHRTHVARVEDARGATVGAGLFDVGNLLGNMRTGEVLARAKFLWMRWHDDEHALVLIDESAELRWTSGRRITLARDPDGDWLHAGRYFVYGTTRIDLTTGAKVTIPSGAIRMRDDGALLFDGGPPKDTDERGPRLGPLRWYARD